MLEHLTTEARNPASEDLDGLSALEIARLINSEDAKVATAVGEQAEAIAQAIDIIAERLGRGGRLIYIGAGTSGRLGVLDAVECPPTFNTHPTQVVGLIAGGHAALTTAVEGAEDRPELAVEDLKNIRLTDGDVVVGIATSGRTPYVLGSLEYAQSIGAFTIGISCNRDPELATRSNLSITPVVGAEVVSGSTRMKAGTATKMVLNMLSTGAMIRLGKTYGNLMVDLRASNSKLADRARRIVRAVTNLSPADSERLLQDCGGEVKTAIVSHYTGFSSAEARQLLLASHGHLRKALEGRLADNGDAR
jgi:N-acetylmuramic acid 6-phosphate etherase